MPAKKDNYGSWPDFDTENVTFDETVEAVYTAYDDVLESTQSRGSRAILLAEGTFGGDAALLLNPLDVGTLPLLDGSPLEGWQVTMPEDGAGVHKVHYLLPDGAENVQIYIRQGESWNKVETTVDGSYLVFALQTGETDFCAVAQPKVPLLPIGVVIAALAVVLLLLLHRGRKRRKAKKAAKAAAQ